MTRKKFREHTTQPSTQTYLWVAKSKSCLNTYNVTNLKRSTLRLRLSPSFQTISQQLVRLTPSSKCPNQMEPRRTSVFRRLSEMVPHELNCASIRTDSYKSISRASTWVWDSIGAESGNHNGQLTHKTVHWAAAFAWTITTLKTATFSST